MRVGFLNINWTDILDVFLVAILLYQVYILVKGSVASKVFLGYLFVYVFYLVVKGLGLGLLTAILQYFMGVGAVAIIVIFQQEIRRFLLIIGKSTVHTNNKFLNRVLNNLQPSTETNSLKKVLDASKMLASNFDGALIVLSRKDDLHRFVETGEALDAEVSKPLLTSIFNQYSELHDGAVIIVRDRVKAARCVLPVADGVPSSLGFRHRAALGMSEATDAVVIVISEQTGKISIAIDGELNSNIALSDLESRLERYLSLE
jgi:diadenylate cyclase